MGIFILRRLLATIPLLLAVSMVVFFLVQIMPGDAAIQRVGDSGTPGIIAEIRKELGLDKPAYERYFTWLTSALRGDLGRSYMRHTPVAGDLAARLPVTLELGAAAMLVAVLIGIPLGTFAALRRGSFLDLIITVIGVLGYSIPSFLIGIGLLYIFVLKLNLGWFPIGGWTKPQDDLVGNLQTLVLPAFTVGIVLAAAVMRLTRSAVLEVLGEDYVRTARAKGLRERVVVWTHVLKNALSPVVTILGLQAGILVGGLVVTESVFSIPGIGRFLVEATRARDAPQIMGTTMLVAIGIALIGIIVDAVYVWLDPRVRVM